MTVVYVDGMQADVVGFSVANAEKEKGQNRIPGYDDCEKNLLGAELIFPARLFLLLKIIPLTYDRSLTVQNFFKF